VGTDVGGFVLVVVVEIGDDHAMSCGFAGVVIPHVTDDQGRLFRIPTDRLLDRLELSVVFAFLC
jgi:hypothetical protein